MTLNNEWVKDPAQTSASDPYTGSYCRVPCPYHLWNAYNNKNIPLIASSRHLPVWTPLHMWLGPCAFAWMTNPSMSISCPSPLGELFWDCSTLCHFPFLITHITCCLPIEPDVYTLQICRLPWFLTIPYPCILFSAIKCWSLWWLRWYFLPFQFPFFSSPTPIPSPNTCLRNRNIEELYRNALY